MSLLHFFLAGLGLFALLQFLILPLLRHRLRVDGTVLSIRRAAVLAVLAWMRSVLLVAVFTTGVLTVLMLALRLRGGSTVQELSSTVEWLQAWRERLAVMSPYWNSGVVVLLVVILGVYAYRRGRVRVERAFREVYERQMGELIERLRRGELEELPPTPEMRQLAQAIEQGQNILAQIDRDPTLAGEDREPQRRAMREEMQRRIAICSENYVMIDLHRRLKLRLDPDVVAPQPPRTRWEKVETFLISQGLLVNLNRAARALYLTSMVLLIACLVGVCAPSTENALTERIVALDDLRVRLSREQVQREWQEAKDSLGEEQAELTAADEKILNQAAARYEQAVGQSDLWRHESLVRPSVYKLRSLAVQDRILERLVRPADRPAKGVLLERHASLSRAEGLRPQEKFVALAYEHALEPSVPTTKHGRRFLGELRDATRRSPALLERLRAEIRLFWEPARPGALSGELTTQVLGLVTGAENADFAPLLHGIDRKAMTDLMDRVLSDQADHAMSRLARGDGLGEVLQGAAEEQPNLILARLHEQAELKQTVRTAVSNVPADEQVLSRLREHPPGIDARLEPHVNPNRASQAVESFHTQTKRMIDAQARMRGQPLPGRIDPGAVTKALASYGDELPAQLGAEQKTLQGKLLAKLESKNPRVSSALAVEEGSLSKTRFFQARDFKRLRGFSRVGGVLIGNDPTRREGPTPDVVDFRWEMDGPKVRLVVVTADGQEVRSRAYRRSLTYLALAYVADGRKVAVTIADAAPLGEHTVLLHPALVDTALGRRVIELDQFIARYTRQDEQQNKAVQTFYAQNFLYQWAWGKRVLAMSENEIERIAQMLKAEFRGKLLEALHQVKEDARRTVQTAEADRKLLAEAWAARVHFGDPRHSPWTARKRYYDESLVRLITTQAEKTANLETFSRSLDAAAAADFQQLVSSFNGAVQRSNEQGANEALRKMFGDWLAGAPRFGLRYIVRERSFVADLPHVILRDGEEPGVPFDLFLQMVFTSEPGFNRQDTEPAEGEEDDRWWEFAALSPSIQRHVTQGVAKDPRAQAILTDVAEFTYLQRLFRASLNGHLGERFPVEKLVALMDVTAPAEPHQTRTLRWDMRQGPREVVAALHWLQELGSELPRLDAAWQPTWLNGLKSRNPLEEADFAKMFDEYSGKLDQELARLPADDKRLPWCRQTFAKLEPYRRLVAEAAIQQAHFKQATERGRDWKAAFDDHARWREEWGQRWHKTWADNRFDPPPARPAPPVAPPDPMQGGMPGWQGGMPGSQGGAPGGMVGARMLGGQAGIQPGGIMPGFQDGLPGGMPGGNMMGVQGDAPGGMRGLPGGVSGFPGGNLMGLQGGVPGRMPGGPGGFPNRGGAGVPGGVRGGPQGFAQVPQCRPPTAPPAAPPPPKLDSRVTHTVETLQLLVHLVEQTHAAQEIRAALGVGKDEEQTLEERANPLPSLD